MKKILWCFTSFLMIISTHLIAGKDEYVCTIQQIQALHSSGNFNSLESYLLGKSFTVDRNTGKITGKPFEHKSYKEIQVLDRGSEKNAYKHIVISNPSDSWAQYFYIREFTNGPKKPFWGTDDGEKIFSGVCK